MWQGGRLSFLVQLNGVCDRFASVVGVRPIRSNKDAVGQPHEGSGHSAAVPRPVADVGGFTRLQLVNWRL